MKAALVGYALAGKTTLFTALHRDSAAAHGQANLGAIKVPDPRVDALSAVYQPRKRTYAEMRFVDLPGPREKGSGLDAESIKSHWRAWGHDPTGVALRRPSQSSWVEVPGDGIAELRFLPEASLPKVVPSIHSMSAFFILYALRIRGPEEPVAAITSAGVPTL